MLRAGRGFMSRLADAIRRVLIRISEKMPAPPIVQEGQLEIMIFPMHIHRDIDMVVGRSPRQQDGVHAAEHEGHRPALRRPVRFTDFQAVPGDIALAAVDQVSFVQMIAAAQRGMCFAKGDAATEESY